MELIALFLLAVFIIPLIKSFSKVRIIYFIDDLERNLNISDMSSSFESQDFVSLFHVSSSCLHLSKSSHFHLSESMVSNNRSALCSLFSIQFPLSSRYLVLWSSLPHRSSHSIVSCIRRLLHYFHFCDRKTCSDFVIKGLWCEIPSPPLFMKYQTSQSKRYSVVSIGLIIYSTVVSLTMPYVSGD